ncbi:hypothetical protein QTP88_006404 [Uroleucon formosanum]
MLHKTNLVAKREILHVGVSIVFKLSGNLSAECAVRPPSRRVAAIPDDANAKAMSHLDRIVAKINEMTNVFPVPPGASRKNRPPVLLSTACINVSYTLCFRFVDTQLVLIENVFPNISENYKNYAWLSQRAILAAKNNDVHALNFTIQSKIAGDLVIYKSVDSITNPDDVVNYPTEFLNSLEIPGFPPYNLQLKVGTVIMILRNLNPPRLCNGTRLSVKRLMPNLIEATIINGKYAGENVCIPRISMIPTDLPFDFKRLQFPVRLAFAMTINKSQGQSLSELDNQEIRKSVKFSAHFFTFSRFMFDCASYQFVQTQTQTAKGPGKSACIYGDFINELCAFPSVDLSKIPDKCTSLIVKETFVDLNYHIIADPCQCDINKKMLDHLDKVLAFSKPVYLYYSHISQEEWTQVLACEACDGGTNSLDEMIGLEAFFNEHPGITGVILSAFEHNVTKNLLLMFDLTKASEYSTEFPGFSENLKKYIEVMKSSFPGLEVGIQIEGRFLIDQLTDPQIPYFESSVSVPSSGEFYEPSGEFDSDDSRYSNISQSEHVLDRTNNSIGITDSVFEDARNLLKLTRNQNQAVKETIMSKFLTTHQALNLIPLFNGENADDSFVFHNACEYALQSIDPAEKENLIRGITTRLIERQVLSAYTEGLTHDTNILVKANRPNKLLECVQIALEEETSRINQKEIRKNINDYKNNGSNFKPSNNYGGKTNSVQKSNSRPPDACFRYGHTNQAKQCRASEADQARYKESQNKSKTETKAIKIVTCNYCKKPNHTTSECRKRKYVNERTAQEQQGTSSGNEQTPAPKLINKHITLEIPQCLTNSIKLLIDTGSDLNMIKLSTLRNEIMVDETQSYQLKGINEYLVRTLGSVNLNLNLGTETLTTKFQVVHDDFPIPHEGILGSPFLAENCIAIDYYSSKIFQINTDPLTLSLRSETIVPIASTRPEGTALVVHSQILQEENIRLGNVKKSSLRSSMLIATNTNEITEDTQHVGRIREATLYQELNEEESDSLWKVISEYPDIFQLEGDSFPSTDAIQHEIHLKEKAKPVNVRPHRLPYAHRQEIVRQMEELESNNIIQPSESPWNTPLIVVSKKPDVYGNPKYRVCVGFRRLNKLTIGDAYPIPRIDEILDQLGRSRYYTTLDLVSGYHQVSIKAEDRQKTAFSTDKGHYEFRGMPFGLSGAPSTFQRLMNTALTGINGTKAFVYLDDIIVYASDLKDHESILRDFLGLSGYYRRFIEGYSQTAKPLTALLNKDVPFEWSTECQRAFEMLKQKLVQAPVLQYPDFERPFILTTDASQFAIGSILSQGTPGQDRPIAYASRTLNKAEQAYSTTDKELLSIVWLMCLFI